MPYVEGTETLIASDDALGIGVYDVRWEAVGQVVSCHPRGFTKVVTYNGLDIKVHAQSEHKAREAALLIAELYTDNLKGTL